MHKERLGDKEWGVEVNKNVEGKDKIGVRNILSKRK